MKTCELGCACLFRPLADGAETFRERITMSSEEDKRLGEVIRVQRRTNGFVMLDKTFLEDDRLSFKAKGILAYLLSRPENWKVIVGHLVTISKEGKAAVYSGLKELKDCGYYEKVPIRNAEGTKIVRWESIIYELPRYIREKETLEEPKSEPKSEPMSVCKMEEKSFAMKITEQLIESCKNSLPEPVNLPDTLEKKKVWAVYIYQLQQAGYSESEIQETMDYATQNAFWKDHIKSTKKFKEKYETLAGQLAKRKGKVPQTLENTLLPDFQEIENQEIENRERNKKEYNNNLKNNNISVMSSLSETKNNIKTDKTETDIKTMLSIIHENIGYEDFQITHPYNMDRVDEIVTIMLDVMLTKGGRIRIDGMDKPIELVKSNLAKVGYKHVNFVMEQYQKQSNKIQKKNRYILSMLYHSVMELDAHYTNLVQYYQMGGAE